MYQFVISKEILPPFTLFYPAHPTTPLPLPIMADQPITMYENTLLFVIMDDDDDNNNLSAKLASFEVTNCVLISASYL